MGLPVEIGATATPSGWEGAVYEATTVLRVEIIGATATPRTESAAHAGKEAISEDNVQSIVHLGLHHDLQSRPA